MCFQRDAPHSAGSPFEPEKTFDLGFSCLQQKSDSENNCSGARPDRRGEGKLVGKTAARHACSMLYKMFGLCGARALRRHASERTRAHTSIE